MIRKTSLMLILSLVLFSLSGAAGREKGPVLVLGFSSPVMDIIEERFLREEVMRALSAGGVTIVPVMKTEELIRSRQNFSPGSVSAAEMTKLAVAAGALMVVAGNVECLDCKGKAASAIDSRFEYRCSMNIIVSPGKGSINLSVKRRGDKNRYRFLRAFGKDIAAALAEKGLR